MTDLQQAALALTQLFETRDFARAKYVAEQIVALDARHADALRILGEITLMQGLWDHARDYADRAVAERPADTTCLLLAARVAQARGDSATTIAWCDQALALRPGDPAAVLTKAVALERAGNWQAAEALLTPFMQTPNPPSGAVHVWALLLLRKGEALAAARAIDALVDQPAFLSAPGAVKARLLFVKAKALDKARDYAGAFAAATQAKTAAAVPFDPAEFTAKADALLSTFSREQLAMFPRAKPTGTRHVFIAGMPRSGTTLVEQILDAHPDAAGVGEAKEIDILAARLPALISSTKPYPACVGDLTHDHVNRFRAEYEAAQTRHGFGPAPLLVNKNLENYNHLGLLALLFPDAKIIVTRRDPRDVAVSCIMSNFKPEKHPYLSTLAHIALAYRQWQRLIEHWRKTLQLPLLDVAYEDLVRDQDAQTRRMLEFAGLPWDQRCAQFWNSGRTVMTLSYDQVSRPMYDSSIGRWKHYERHLQPFLRGMSDDPASEPRPSGRDQPRS